MNTTTENTANNRVIEKIRKLLARADSTRNDNPHEREIAMRQAMSMLARHGLEVADVGDVDAKPEGAIGRSAAELMTKNVWERCVWAAVAKLYGCDCVLHHDDSGRRVVWVLGRKLRVDIVRSVAAYAIQSIIRESRANRHDTLRFGAGAASGISQQVATMLANMAKGDLGDGGEQLSESRALIVVNQREKALVDARSARSNFWPDSRWGSTRGSSARLRDSRDANSYSAGKSYGSSMSLNNQIGSGGGGQRRIGRS